MTHDSLPFFVRQNSVSNIMMQIKVNLTESKGTLNIDIANYNFQTAFLHIVILRKTLFNKAVEIPKTMRCACKKDISNEI